MRARRSRATVRPLQPGTVLLSDQPFDAAARSGDPAEIRVQHTEDLAERHGGARCSPSHPYGTVRCLLRPRRFRPGSVAGKARGHRGVRHAVRRSPRVESVRRAKERSEEHTSELQSLMRISYAVFCLKKKK